MDVREKLKRVRMSRYHIVFTDRLGGKLAEHGTDIEPPVRGDIVRLDHLTDFKDENVYLSGTDPMWCWIKTM